jgi:glycosyltransferase involved in cell wall biosynthesis
LKILLLCNKVPYPANDGSSIAMASIINALCSNKAEVDVLAFNTSKHQRSLEEIRDNTPEKVALEYIYLDNRTGAVSALRNLFSSHAYQVSRFRSKEYRKTLIAKLQENDYDLVQIEGLSMAVYLREIRQYSTARIVLRAHNVETLIWERHLQSEKNPLIRFYLRLQNRRLAKFEKEIAYETDAIVAITREDLGEFWRLQPGKVAMSLPCGVEINDYPECKESEKTYDMTYIASFDWLPNQQGLRWFIDQVWPLILEKRPKSTFRLAGRHMPVDIVEKTISGFSVEGEVEDMKAFMCSGKLAVVPLLAGSGMRIKILENMALGLCQVTTSIGAEGIEIEDGENIVIANDPSDLATQIVELLDDPERIRQIGKKARETVITTYTNKNLGKQLMEFYEYEVCR